MNVVNRLQAHRQPHEVVGHAGGDLLLGCELLVGRGRRVNDQALRVSDVGEVREQLHRVDELDAGLATALIPKPIIAPWPCGRYLLAFS